MKKKIIVLLNQIQIVFSFWIAHVFFQKEKLFLVFQVGAKDKDIVSYSDQHMICWLNARGVMGIELVKFKKIKKRAVARRPYHNCSLPQVCLFLKVFGPIRAL